MSEFNKLNSKTPGYQKTGHFIINGVEYMSVYTYKRYVLNNESNNSEANRDDTINLMSNSPIEPYKGEIEFGKLKGEYVQLHKVKTLEEYFKKDSSNEKSKEDEIELLKNTIDELIERFKVVEQGQQRISKNLENELKEIKKYVDVVPKKKIRDMIVGALVNGGFGTLSDVLVRNVLNTNVIKGLGSIFS